MTPGAADVRRFRDAVARRMGLSFEDGKLDGLADVLERRVKAARVPVESYLAQLEAAASREEVIALARELTVAETYFLRNMDQFRAFSAVALPDRMRQSVDRRLQILSAGCASGEEAYSLAICARDVADDSWDVSIRGVDVNAEMVTRARQGRFTAWALRDTPDDVQQRWFTPQGREFVLDDALRQSVAFEQQNLLENASHLWRPAVYDVVFCRNVLMYLVPEAAQSVVAHITRALRPGGYLFLGHAETLRGLSNDFHLLHTHGTFYYQRKTGVEEPRAVESRSGGSHVSLAAAVDGAQSWVDAIRQAAERIENLTRQPSAAAASAGQRPAPRKPAWDLGMIIELLRSERFTEALDLVQTLPPESLRDPDVLLLRAVLLAHSGQLAHAEDACRHLLEVDELSGGAHYVLALCREGRGDRTAAAHHDQVAVYLDPGFAMPRLHLGLLARRGGDLAAARRELGQALVLLQREDAARLILFGGGFSRDALVTLCRAELRASGGTS